MFKKYKRKEVAELRKIETHECRSFHTAIPELRSEKGVVVSISSEDLKNGSPKPGDMVARNPKNHDDQWLVAEKYFEDNFEEIN